MAKIQQVEIDVDENAQDAGTGACDMASVNGPRAPQQARGKARVEIILDAAAALVVETGVAGVTMHKVAKRAKTPIGSMYHFFPDRDALISAMALRHQEALAEIDCSIHRLTNAQWQAFSAAEVIDQIVTPFIDYFERMPDCLAVIHAKPNEHRDKDKGIRHLREVLDARIPQATPAERQLYAEMMNALAVGSLTVRLEAAGQDMLQAGRYFREMRRALVLYLTDVEAAHAQPRG
jgi:AcrR family transcriptional regulator